MKVKTAIFAIPGTTGNHSFNITGWNDIPVAVKVEVIGTSATNGYTDTSIFAIGFADGVREYCIGHHVANGLTTTECERATKANIIAIPNISGGTLEYSATFSQWNTGGIELTFAGSPNSAHRIQITYFAGADVSARADYALQAAHVETVGFTSKLIFTSTAGAGAFVADDFGIISLGVTTNGVNGVTNSFSGIDYRSGQSLSMATAYVSNTLCTAQPFNGGITWSGSITSIDSLGFNFSSDAGSDYVIFLALTFDGDVDSGVSAIPTTGNISITDPGFTPQSVGVIPTNLTAINTVNTISDTVIGIGMADASYEGSLTVSGEDGVNPTNHTSVHSLNLLHGEDPDQVSIYDVSFGSFTSSGFDLTVNTSPATATYFVWWAIEAEAGGTAALTGDIVGSAIVAGVLSGRIAITGATTGNAVVAGSISGNASLSGATGGEASVAGDLTVTFASTAQLSGNIVGTSVLTGMISGVTALTGAATGTTVLDGSISGSISLTGAVAGDTILAGSLSGNIALTGAAFGDSSLTGNLTIVHDGAAPLSGGIVGTSSVTGSLSGTIALTGAVLSTSDLAGSLTITVGLSGQIWGASVVSGVISGILSLTGSAEGTSVVAGNLFDPSKLYFEKIYGDSNMTPSLTLDSIMTQELSGNSQMTKVLTLNSYMHNE